MTLPNLPFELSTTLIEQLGDDAHTVEEQYSKLFEWMIQKGKNPRRMKGINKSTADDYIQRLDQLHRFLLQYLDPEDPTKIRDNQADKLLRLIDRGEITQYQGRSNGEEYNESSKRKFANALEMYFKWLYYSEEAIEYEWESKIDFSNGKTNPADTFTYREIGLLFREAESYGKLPSYYDTPPEKRDKIDALVAQRLGLPKDEVTQGDWLQADWSAKFSSLMLVGYDAGLTPKEVENMKVHWYDPQQKILRIPSEKACKEREKEAVGLSDQGADALEKWLQERRHRSKYDGTDRVWLNRVGSGYKSGSLCKLIRKLCRQAGINISDRKIVWYSLRKSMGTYVTDEGDITEANDQLRHQRLETTQEKYNTTPIKKRQARLNETHRTAEHSAENPEWNPFDEKSKDKKRASKIQSNDEEMNSGKKDEIVSQLGGGDIHVDARIPDTTEAKVDVTRRILDDSSED